MQGFDVFTLRETKTAILLQVFKVSKLEGALAVVMGWSEQGMLY
jgi:hypothetical protein